jgi:hypothetical protein
MAEIVTLIATRFILLVLAVLGVAYLYMWRRVMWLEQDALWQAKMGADCYAALHEAKKRISKLELKKEG